MSIKYIIDKIMKYCRKPYLIIGYLAGRFPSLFKFVPDKICIKMQFEAAIGQKLDLKNPKTFNEKIQWLKLHGDLQKYANLADKYEVRKFVSNSIGEEYLIPLLGVWNKFEDIDFSKLPEQFVLKCNHDSNSVVICKDKTTFNIKKSREKLNKCLKRKFYYAFREYQYKNIKPKLIGEKYMVDESENELKDYKIYCFNGNPKIIQVIYDRCTDSKANLYDIEWNYIPVVKTYPTNPNRMINKPSKLDEILHLAKMLSKNCLFVRVDFYSVNDKIYFGELTFTPAAGLGKFEPKEFDFEMGSWIELPKERE